MNKLTIRKPNDEQLIKMIKMGEQFWALTKYAKDIPYDPESTWFSCETMRDQNLLFACFNENDDVIGFIGGMKSPAYTNFTIEIGQELFWWVEPQYRNGNAGTLLLETIEQSAREQGLKYWSMIYLVNIEPKKAQEMYISRGYTQSEISFTKRL